MEETEAAEKPKESDNGPPKKARPYQVELLQHALRENTIVNLGTGAGKTFVAVMLIREMSPRTEGAFNDEKGQRTIFLAHTVPLVKQQAKYINDNTDLKVQYFCGDFKGIDSWSKEKWYQLFGNYNVLVMINQIFLDLLNRAVIKPRQLNLIVIDECHHATKNDPYVQIMKVIKDAPANERPRILGLSASLLAKKVKPGELKKGVKGLEEILMSCARTSQDLKEVIEHATAPNERISNYSSDMDSVSLELKNVIDGPLKFLQMKWASGGKKFPIGNVAKNLLEDLMSILTDLGSASAAEFVQEALREMRKAMATRGSKESYDYALGTLGLTHLTIFDIKCREFKEKYGKLGDSDKVKMLLLILGDIAVQHDDLSESEGSPKSEEKPIKKEELRGIIFVERRYTASSLSKLIRRKRKEDKDLCRIQCDFVVGHNVGQNATSLRKEARMKSKHQDEVLEKFRKGRINILIATSVIEEGVDVPKCNLVVRFDLPQNFRSYVQSKGRARNKPSLFYLLVGDNQSSKLKDIANYHSLEKELTLMCQKNRSIPSEESIQKRMKDKLPPYMPYGREGARATIGNSLTILHRYCQKLPHDEYTRLTPSFSVVKLPKERLSSSLTVNLFDEEEEDEDPNHDYICTLTLPINCPLKETIKSPKMESKLQSQRAAALVAVEELHKLGELDERFFPAPSNDSDDEEIQLEKRNLLAGTERRHRMYRNEISDYLKDCLPQPDKEVFLYAFVIRKATSGDLYYSCAKGYTSHNMLGILTSKELPYWKIPKFSLYVKGKEGEEKEVELTVSLLPVSEQLNIISEELKVLKNCHHSIFSEVLKIIPPCFVNSFDEAEKNYLVVPVAVKGFDGEQQITSGNISFEVASSIIDLSEYEVPNWPYPSKTLDNALVTVCHRDSMIQNGELELFEVEVDDTVSPLSPFPTPKYKSFEEYYKDKHDYEIKDLDQPGLKATRVGISYLKYLTSRYTVSSSQEYPKPRESKKAHVILFPEVVKIFPIATNVFKLLRCLPSILWRLESLLLIEDLSRAADLGDLDFESKIFTDTPLRGHRDIGFGDLPTQVLKYDGNKFVHKMSGLPSQKDIFSRGPDNSLLLQAMTPKAANDSVNLERLELLGDSFLKLASSIYLLNDRETDHERRLSSARSRRISNLRLFFQAKRKSLFGKILSNDLLMGPDSNSPLERLRFMPPGYLIKPKVELAEFPYEIIGDEDNFKGLEDHVKYLYHRFSDKMAADCMEGLIGACTVSGGIEGGLKMLKWLDVGVAVRNEDRVRFHLDQSLQMVFHHHGDKIPLTIDQSSYIFQKHFGCPPLIRDADTKDREAFNRLLSLTLAAQRKIGYQFTHHMLLIEAMTHPSYARNSITGCYQRLEFLGDAVIDYLITSYLYHHDRDMDPGKGSSLRSAVVCNTRLAELTVTLDLHKNMQHSSPELFKKMEMYAHVLNERSQADAGISGQMESLILEEEEDDDDEEDESTEAENEEEETDDEGDEDMRLDPPKPLGDIFEALCGAVFLDTGMSLEKTWDVFKGHFVSLLLEYEKDTPVHPIKRLYDLIPEGIKVTRQYISAKEGSRCRIRIKDKGIDVEGVSRIYKNAKNIAANKALRALTTEN